jgi:hypothetical protein
LLALDVFGVGGCLHVGIAESWSSRVPIVLSIHAANIAGLLVAVAPRIGAWVVAAWLCGIIVNRLVLGTYFDVALRDLGVALGAAALARLSADYSDR